MISNLFLSILNMSFSACLLILAVIAIRCIVMHRIPRRFLCILWALVAVRLILPFSVESELSLIPSVSVLQVKEVVVEKTEHSESLGGLERPVQGEQEMSLDASQKEFLQVHSGFALFDEMTNRYLGTRPVEVRVHRPAGETQGKEDAITGELTENNPGVEGTNGDFIAENNSFAGTQGESLAIGNTEEGGLASQEVDKPVNVVATLWHVLPFIWCIGVVAILLYAFYSYFRLGRKLKVSVEQEKGIYICDAIDMPFVLGLISPKVYFPSNMEEDAFTYVVEHEKMHVARMDHLWKAIGYLLLAINWMNPLVWVAYILFCRDVELACDESVIRDKSTEFKQAYAMTLFSYSVQGGSVGLLPLAFGEGSVKDRINSVMKYKKPPLLVLGAGVLLCVVVAILFLTNPKEEKSDLGSHQETMDSKEPEKNNESMDSMDSVEPNASTESGDSEGSSNSADAEDKNVFHSRDEIRQVMNKEIYAFMEQEGMDLEALQSYETVHSNPIDYIREDSADVNIVLRRWSVLVLNADGTLTAFVKDAKVREEWSGGENPKTTVLDEKPAFQVGAVNSLETAKVADVIGLDGAVDGVLFTEYFAEDLQKINPEYYQMLKQPDTALKYYLQLENVQTEWIPGDEHETLVICTFENGETVRYLMGKMAGSSVWEMNVCSENPSRWYEQRIDEVYKKQEILKHIDVNVLRNETVYLEELRHDHEWSEFTRSYSGFAIISELKEKDTALYGYWDGSSGMNDLMILRKGTSVYTLYLDWDNMYGDMPDFYEGDFDGDGETEYAIVQLIGTGTGYHQRGLKIIEISGLECEIYDFSDYQWIKQFEKNVTWIYHEEDHSLQFFDGTGQEIAYYLLKEADYLKLLVGNINDFYPQGDSLYLDVMCSILPGMRRDTDIRFTCEVNYSKDGSFQLGKIVQNMKRRWEVTPITEIEESAIKEKDLYSLTGDVTQDGSLDVVKVSIQYPEGEDATNEKLLEEGYSLQVRVLKTDEAATEAKILFQKTMRHNFCQNLSALYLVHDNGMDYLLNVALEGNDTIRTFSYQVFYLKGEEQCILEENAVTFGQRISEKVFPYDEVVNVTENLQKWMDKGELIAVVDPYLCINIVGEEDEFTAKDIWKRDFKRYPKLEELLN